MLDCELALHRSHLEFFWMGGKDQLHDVNVEISHVQQLGHGGRFPEGRRPIFDRFSERHQNQRHKFRGTKPAKKIRGPNHVREQPHQCM